MQKRVKESFSEKMMFKLMNTRHQDECMGGLHVHKA